MNSPKKLFDLTFEKSNWFLVHSLFSFFFSKATQKIHKMLSEEEESVLDDIMQSPWIQSKGIADTLDVNGHFVWRQAGDSGLRGLRNLMEKEEHDMAPYKRHIEHIESLTAEEGIALISECESECCAMTRANNPVARVYIENKIVEFARTLILAPSEPFVYTALYPGFFYQDLVILARLKHGTDIFANRQVHLYVVGHEEYESYDFSASYVDPIPSRATYMYLYRFRLCLFQRLISAMNINVTAFRFFSDPSSSSRSRTSFPTLIGMTTL